MAEADAATSGKRRQQQHMQEQKSVPNSRKICRRTADKKLQSASKVFDSLANEAGRLDEEALVIFLATSLLIPRSKLQPDALQMVRNEAQRGFRCSVSAEAMMLKQSKSNKISFSKAGMMRAFEKYGLYLQKRDEVDAIFEKFDRDDDGQLSRKDLLRLLEQREKHMRPPRSINGIEFTLIFHPEDLDFVLNEADADGDALIGKSELLPALALWEELAEKRVEEMQKQGLCACTIL